MIEYQGVAKEKSEESEENRQPMAFFERRIEEQRMIQSCSHEYGIFTTFHARWEVSRELRPCHFPRASLPTLCTSPVEYSIFPSFLINSYVLPL